jgi:hypothetical protein
MVHGVEILQSVGLLQQVKSRLWHGRMSALPVGEDLGLLARTIM